MTLLHIAVLALVQGITEFLPISSQGHLVLVDDAFDMLGPAESAMSADRQLVMIVAVHVGSLGAVVAYLWRDLLAMARGLVRAAVLRRTGPGLRLFGLVIVATVPVVIAGYLVDRFVGNALRSAEVIGWTTLVFAFALYAADRMSLRLNRIEHMTMGVALSIGLAQVLALVPGTSRSGVTMTAARAFGFERVDAARFSMLMSIPAILGAGVLKGVEIYRSEDVSLGHDAGLAAGLAFIAALVAIVCMMAWLRRATFAPFVVYRIWLGILLLAWVYGVI